MKKRTLAMLLCIVMTLSFLPTASLAESIEFEFTSVTNATELKEQIANVNAPGTVKLENDIDLVYDGTGVQDNALNVTRDVTLDLNGKTLKIDTSYDTNGIKIFEDVTLTITDTVGTGELLVTVSGEENETPNTNFGAGINTSEGTLKILGGKIVSTGGNYGAGIGGGYDNGGGSVTISENAIVTAAGGLGGAGIGGGHDSSNSTGCDVTISGNAHVLAIGGEDAETLGTKIAAIGAPSGANQGTLTITGGSLVVVTDATDDATTIAVGEDGAAVSPVSIEVTGIDDAALDNVAIAAGDYTALADASGKATIWINEPENQSISISRRGYLTSTNTAVEDGGVYGVTTSLEASNSPALTGEATVAASVAVNAEFNLDLTSLFEDEENDVLTYFVKIGEEDFAETASDFTVVPQTVGEVVLVFKAYDGATFSGTYTVTLKVVAAHTINYDANGGEGTMDSDTVISGESYTVKENGFTYENFVFTGWSTVAPEVAEDAEVTEEADESEEPETTYTADVTEYQPEDVIENVTANITFYAQWEELDEKWENPFIDVNEDDWFYGDVEYVVTNGLFKGTSTTTFSPATEITRGMIVTLLGRLSEVETDEYEGDSFTDVNSEMYYAPYIKWAAEEGLVKGIGENKFAPDVAISRQDLAVILFRYATFIEFELPSTATEADFEDADSIWDYAVEAIKAMQEAELVNGKPGNIFDPLNTSKRSEVAALFHRFCELVK